MAAPAPEAPDPAGRNHGPRSRARRVPAALAVACLGLVIAVIPLARWAASVTGEENSFEALKGAVALTLLEARSDEADLKPFAPATGEKPYGVNTFLQLEADPTVVDRTFTVLSESGVTWARQEFPWEDIEIHGAGDFEDRRHVPYRSAWDKYDRIVQAASDHGVKLLVRLDNPPDWAFADPVASGEKGPPDDPERFGDFVAAVAGRYCDTVTHYQIWNEPNIYPEWGERDVDPAAYSELLALAARRVREACPTATIVSAALAPTTEPGGRNLDDLSYLEALYQAGAAEHFDILGVQAFGLWTGPGDRRASRDRTNFARTLLAREVMVAHGDEAKPMWITEMGWNSPPASLDVPDRDKYGRASEDVRARYLSAAYERMAAEWPWAEVGFVWMLRRPDWEWHGRPEGWFRLVEPDWTRTPSMDALGRIAGAPPVLHWGTSLPNHPALTRSGPWQDGAGGRTAIGSAGAELVFPFEGSGYELVVEEPATYRAFVVLDGITGTVSAADGVVEGAEMLRATGLGSGSHTGIVRVEEGELPLAAVVIQPPAATSWWRGGLTGIAVLALAAIAGVGLVVLAARRPR